MIKYFIQVPSDFYALNFYANSKQDAIKQYKSWAKIDRMPRGYAIWRA